MSFTRHVTSPNHEVSAEVDRFKGADFMVSAVRTFELK